jgi:tetratricopeptide (TPR) repeat protein
MTHIAKPIFLLVVCVSGIFSQAQTATRITNAEIPGGKTNSVRAATLFNQATQLLDAKQYTQAIKLYEQALTADSNYVNALDNLGLAFYELEKLDSAEYFFGISLRKNPNGAAALQNMGLVMEGKNEPDKAIEYYQKITKVSPNNGQGFYNQARVYGSAGMLEKALPLALQAQTLFQNAKSPDLPIAHDLLLRIYYAMHNIPKAKEYLALCKKDNLEIDPGIEKALN